MTTFPSLMAARRQDDAPVRRDMPRSLVLLFAATCTLSVANVYYVQPLLDALALDFNISHAAVGGVITATQVGCAFALLFLVPLGDLVDRRRLMAVQLLALVSRARCSGLRAIDIDAAGRHARRWPVRYSDDAGADRLRGQCRRTP